MRSSTSTFLRLSTLLSLVAAACLVAGCRDPSSAPQAGGAGGSGAAGLGIDKQEETWEVNEIGGVNVGYDRTVIRPESLDGRPVLHISQTGRLRTLRAGQPTELVVEIESVETPEGGLVQFESRVGQRPGTLVRTFGRVVDDKLEVRVGSPDGKPTNVIPWSDEYGGFYASDLSLRRDPMEPGEHRTIRALVPAVNLVGTNELAAADYETVDILGQKHKLLRIDATISFPGGIQMQGTSWCNASGEVLKEYQQQMDLLSYRAPKEVALESSERARFDLVLGLSVPVERELETPYATKRVRYKLSLEKDDPAKVFPSGPSQKVRSTGRHTAEVTVYAVRPGEPGNPDARRDEPTEADLAPNHLIQSDDAKIVSLAKEAAGAAEGPWATAVALESFVHDYITQTDYSQAFATASDVVASKTGDCTEHAVLLAALARVRGIPARVAVGLVYTHTASGPAFAYHMWNEVHVDGRWIPLDATLARGGVDAAHLKLGHSNLEGASAFGSFLPVAQVAGRLKIEVLEVE